MDSHSFRLVATELAALLDGARLEKIYGPHPGVTVFTCRAFGVKYRLVLRHERQAPLLFLSGLAPANPARPPASVMRLRKYCAGRRLGRGRVDFVSRQLLFPLLLPPDQPPCQLLLDLAQGPAALEDVPEGFAAPPVWPGAKVVDALCSRPWNKGEKQGPWQQYALLTPLLRETLAALDPPEGRALLVDLEAGGGELFLYADAVGCPVLYSAWPLPDEVCARRGLAPHPGLDNALREALAPDIRQLLPDFPALAAASLVDGPRFFAGLGQAAHKEEAVPLKKAARKQQRLLAKLQQEEARLTAMLALREDARRLQGVIWQYPAEEKRAGILLPQGPLGETEREIALDPLYTVRENMARMFRQSDRGARGLALLRERRAEILAEEEARSGPDRNAGQTRSPLGMAPASAPETAAGTALLPESASGFKDVARFLSSDGYVLLRGKNARGNQSLLKIGSAHDLWLHAEDGPSAHLIIRRAHAADEPPERTLREAALLVGEKSWQRGDSRVRIMMAQLRHVHAVRGAKPGTVRVDAVLRSLSVPTLQEPDMLPQTAQPPL